MSPREIAEDLDYVRTLAEEGRHAPLLGGPFLVFWGLLNGIAYGLHWGLVSDFIVPNPTWHFGALWASYGVCAGVGSSLISVRVKDLPGQSSLGNRVERTAWLGAGLGIMAVVIGAIGHMVISGDTLAVDMAPPAVFALYGSALMITGIVAKEQWLGRFAVLSYGIAIVLGLYLSAPWFYLLASLGSVVVLLTPGLMLLRKLPSTTV